IDILPSTIARRQGPLPVVEACDDEPARLPLQHDGRRSSQGREGADRGDGGALAESFRVHHDAGPDAPLKRHDSRRGPGARPFEWIPFEGNPGAGRHPNCNGRSIWLEGGRITRLGNRTREAEESYIPARLGRLRWPSGKDERKAVRLA